MSEMSSMARLGRALNVDAGGFSNSSGILKGEIECPCGMLYTFEGPPRDVFPTLERWHVVHAEHRKMAWWERLIKRPASVATTRRTRPEETP